MALVSQRTGSATGSEPSNRFLPPLHVLIGRFVVAAVLTIPFLGPAVNPNSAVAGWPLNYVCYDLSSFKLSSSVLGFLVDLGCWMLLCLTIFTPVVVSSRLRQGTLRLGRAAVCCGFLGLFLYTSQLLPRRFARIEEQHAGAGSSRVSYVGSPLEQLCAMLEARQWLPKVDRNRVYQLQSRGLDQESTEQVLSLPRLREVTLFDCDVSIDVLPILLNKAPNLTAVRLKDVDPDARLPELPPLPSNLILDLAGRTIEVSDIEKLIRARPKFVLLDRCQFSPEAIEKAKKHEATAESPVLVLQSNLM